MSGRVPSRLIIATVLALGVPLAASSPVPAPAPITIKLGTLAPENSPWTDALNRMGTAWKKATDGRVSLRVMPPTYPNESSIISRMGVDNLQAATLMVAGLGEIDPAFNVFGIPFFFESDAELDYVQKKMTPMFSQKLEAKKYHLINWGIGGWVRLFSKKAIRSIPELQAASLYTTEGDPKAVQWYGQSGFHAVPLAQSEIPKQLKLPTGAINAAPSPPVWATLFFRDAPYMLDQKLGPLVAATIMTDQAWQQISPEDRLKILAEGAATEKAINAASPDLDAKAIDEMRKNGLNVVAVDAKNLAEFRAAAEKVTSSQRGFLVPAEAFDSAVRERDAYRKANRK
jgi:TRAP-type transport system periplasmic protein